MTDASPAPPSSAIRNIVGWLCLFCAVLLLVLGMVQLVAAFETYGYGSSAVRYALIVLGISGALWSAGLALLVWEFSGRYNIQR